MPWARDPTWVIAPAGEPGSYAPRVESPHSSLSGPGVRLSVNSASSSQRQRRAGATAFHRLTLPLDPDGAVHVEALAIE